MTDADHMRRALFHAGRAVGATTPNPLVGAVVVSADGVVVGQGRHQRAGEPHAEVYALQEAGERARGGTLYVTLEPCCFYGRTAPCAPLVIGSGVARVVVAMEDPNPRVKGQGIAELRAAGLAVDVGLMAAEAARLNRAFITVHTYGRPEVVLKAAISRDGYIAARRGERTAITGPAALRRAQRLRAMVDAVAVGSDTVLVDDPLLTVRDTVRARPLTRVIFDRRLRTPANARVLSTREEGPVIILTSRAAVTGAPERVAALTGAGASVVEGADDLPGALSGLLAADVSSLLVEGGAALHRAFVAAGLVDVVHLVRAPRDLGPDGVAAFGGLDPTRGLTPQSVTELGGDVWMEFDVHRNH